MLVLTIMRSMKLFMSAVHRLGEISALLAFAILLVTSLGFIFVYRNIPTIKKYTGSAQTNCLYSAKSVVVKNNKNGELLTSVENGITPWGVSNNKESQTIPAGKFSSVASFRHTNPNYNFHQYYDGERASVRLMGLNQNKYRIISSFCDSLTPNAKGCDYGVVQSADRLSLNNFHVTCGVDIKYGWVVEEVESAPTPTPETISCNGVNFNNNGGYGVDTKEWEMGKTHGAFSLSYNMFTVPDLLEIFYEDKLIFSTNGPVSGEIINNQISFGPGTSTKIKVVVTGNIGGTIWVYKISCPDINPTPTPSCQETTGNVSGKLEIAPGIMPVECRQHGGCGFYVQALNFVGFGSCSETIDQKIFVSESNPVYNFTNLPANCAVLVGVDRLIRTVDDTNNTLGFVLPFAANCFSPRKFGGSFNTCVTTLNNEPSCKAENFDFSISALPPVMNKDLNNDNIVNVIDYVIMLKQYGRRGIEITADINVDGRVDAQDASLMLRSLGEKK